MNDDSVKNGMLITKSGNTQHIKWGDIQYVAHVEYQKYRNNMNLTPYNAINRLVNFLYDFGVKRADEAYLLALGSAVSHKDLKK